MASSPPSAGGVLLALAAIVGTAIGLVSGEPSIGFLAGMAVGGAAALAIWWRQRR